MTLKDQRLDYLRKLLDAHGFVCERRRDSDSDLHQFVISHAPDIDLVISKELLVTNSWLFIERAEQAVGAGIDAKQDGLAGILTMRFLDVAWQPRLVSL
jgi:hypothetical protein